MTDKVTRVLRSSRFFLLSVLLITAATASAAQEPQTRRVLTPEVIITIAQVVDAQISPDGTQVAYQVSRPRAESDPPGGARGELWIVPVAGGEPRRLTQEEDRAARWSPDGKTLAFLGRRGKDALTQVHLINPSAGEARALTTAPAAVSSYKWSPDGRSIAFTYADPKTEDEKKAEAAGRDWTVYDQNFKHTRLYRIDLASGKTELVTQADKTVHDYDWSPDSTQLVIGAADTPTIDDSFMGVRLYIVPAAGGVPEPFVKTEGKLGFPRWSPDGQWIAWLGASALNDPYAGTLYVAPVRNRPEGAPDRVNLTTAFEGTATWLAWQPGAPATAVFVAAERQTTPIYRVPASAPRRDRLGSPLLVVVGGPTFSSDGKRVAMVANTPSHPNEVYVADGSAAPKRLTTLNPQLAGVELGTQEVVVWNARDGKSIEGVLVKPVGFRAGQRYPLIVQPHGGPEAADPNGWNGTYSRWGQMLAGQGFLTLYPNYRGSIGRGAEFAMADHKDLMGKEFEDMIDGIDHLVKEGLADGDKVGIGGGSYGGYTSAWATTFASDRFKAAIPWMGISNWISMTGTSDIFLENSTVHWDLVMYDNYEKYWERSPLKYIDRAKTPTLIVHGAADPRVPPGQSLELYTALKWKGVPVQYVTYPREGHGVGERAHQLDFMNRVQDWFIRYVR
jgi:dipeptidyl aminopeptidase/acylaminoacyl peptidase